MRQAPAVLQSVQEAPGAGQGNDWHSAWHQFAGRCNTVSLQHRSAWSGYFAVAASSRSTAEEHFTPFYPIFLPHDHSSPNRCSLNHPCFWEVLLQNPAVLRHPQSPEGLNSHQCDPEDRAEPQQMCVLVLDALTVVGVALSFSETHNHCTKKLCICFSLHDSKLSTPCKTNILPW